MKWSDHRKITLEVCEYYGLENAREIAEASVLPDKDPDYYRVRRRGRSYRRRVPHHDALAVDYGFKYLKEARKKFVSREDFSEPLGRALHYFQDFSVDPTKKLWIFSYRSEQAHEERESLVSLAPVDVEAVREAAKLRCFPHEFRKRVFSAGRGKTPEEIMRIASFLTSLAVKLVIKPDRPENLAENYRKALAAHVALVLSPWILTALEPSLFAFSLLGSYLAHKLNPHFRKWRTDREWFPEG